MSVRYRRWAVAAALIAAGCSSQPPPQPQLRAVVVEAPQPLTGPAGAEVYPGAVRARHEADLSFRVPGKIARRLAELGTRVEPGTVLAELDPNDAQLNLDAAQSAVAAAEADAQLARSEDRRYRELFSKGYVNRSAVDARINTLRLAEARLEQAQAQLELARNQSRYTHLTADARGVVTQVYANAGAVVAAGQPVLHFAQDGEREVGISVPEGRADALRAAAQLAVELYSQPGKRYAGRLRDLTPQADQVTRTHEARITLVDAPADIPLGVSATVLVLGATDARVFDLPASALGALDAEHPVVWKLQPAAGETQATVQAVPVQVVRYLDGRVLVSGDIGVDDRLVTAGVNLLRPGMPVQPIERTAKAAL
ncbi:MAG: efflux RND transporter periplasmic adaptor subunit [Sinimarinibacterium sp.]|jgi:multidrug efflux system membrane fusion protein